MEATRASIRLGRWKLFAKQNSRTGTVYTELFDIVADPGETRDRSASELETVHDLMARLHRYGAQAAPPLPRPASMDREPPEVWGTSVP